MSNKYLFAVLLAANVLVFIWEASLRVPAEDNPASDTATLQLLSEQGVMPAAVKADSISTGTATAAPLPDSGPTAVPGDRPEYTVCLEVGPFDGKTYAAAAERWLSRRRTQVWMRSEPPLNGLDFFVYLPRMEQRDLEAALNESHEKGLNNFSTVRDERGELRVSFGKFSTESQAKARQRQLAHSGIHAQVHAASRTTPAYWVDVASERGSDLLAETRARFRERALPRQIDCAKLASLNNG